MIDAQQLFKELIDSLRNVIAPAIPDPYPRTQAYMAAVILEFISRQVDERSDLAARKSRAMSELFADLAKMPELARMPGVADTKRDENVPSDELRLAKLIEALYESRGMLGDAVFNNAQARVRRTLRELLDVDLKIAGKAES